jgi:hypothetical protein
LIQGFFHIKSSISYQHLYELVPKDYKKVGSTFINVLDLLGLCFVSLLLKYYTKDIDKVFQVNFMLGTGAFVIYFLLIPESPKWLFMKEGSQSQRGIEVMNYISWINGSDFRLRSGDIVDLNEDESAITEKELEKKVSTCDSLTKLFCNPGKYTT